MLSQQILTYSVEDVQRIVAQAYQSGINAGYMMAVKEDMLELESMKREQELQAIIESQEGEKCGSEC